MSRKAKPTAMLKEPRLPGTSTGSTVGKMTVAAASAPTTASTSATTRLITSAKLGRPCRR